MLIHAKFTAALWRHSENKLNSIPPVNEQINEFWRMVRKKHAQADWLDTKYVAVYDPVDNCIFESAILVYDDGEYGFKDGVQK